MCTQVHFPASCGLKHIKICVTREQNVDHERSNNCILSFCIALNHLPKEIFTVILRTSFRYSTAKSLIHMKAQHMLKINFTQEVLLLKRNVCFRN